MKAGQFLFACFIGGVAGFTVSGPLLYHYDCVPITPPCSPTFDQCMCQESNATISASMEATGASTLLAALAYIVIEYRRTA